MPACARTVLCLFADTQSAENNERMRSFHNEWTAPLGYLGPPAAFGLLSRRYEHQFGLDYAALGKLAVAQRGHAVLNELAWRSCASRSRSTTISTRA